MTIVHIDDISIPDNRFRREFDPRKLAELEDSIKRNGLMQPIIVERFEDAWILRAGERRLKVLQGLAKSGVGIRFGLAKLAPCYVPVLEYGELSDLQRLEIEVEENVVRSDFTWQERQRALAALHQLRLKQNPQQTLQQTASEILGKPAKGSQIDEVSQALIVSRHLGNPEVAKAKNTKEALKIIRKQQEAIHAVRLAKNFDTQKTEHRLIRGRAEEILPTLADGSFDVIVTDPPYGVGADNFGSMAATAHDYKDTRTKFKEMLDWLPEQLFRVAKPRAHCYIFCDQRHFIEMETHMVLARWTVFPTQIIWYKRGGMLPLPEHGPRRTYESILYAYKGDRKTLAIKPDCIVEIPLIQEPKRGAQKPVELYCDLLGRSANPGDVVLDCFGGTGPILVAANRMRLVATYIELSEEAFAIATSRALTKDIDDGVERDDGLEIDFGS